MIKNIRNLFFSMLMVASFGGALMTMAYTPMVSAKSCTNSFLGFPTWYRGLPLYDPANCDIASPNTPPNDIKSYILRIGMNVVQMALVAVAYASGFLTLYGGFLFITSRGNPEGAANARKTMLNAIIGLIISMVAVISVDFIFTKLIAASTGVAGATTLPVVTASDVLAGALGLVYFVAGSIAVIVIVLSGFSFSTSVYDPAKVAQAKNAILYSVVGLVVVIMAFIITQFIMGRF